ncbi:MAG: hypothetical protein ACR2QM_01285 [Longimicrobiales bacterium]
MPGLRSTLTMAVAGAVALPALAQAQDWTQREFPLAPPNADGNFVAPYFDGFYENEDGSYTLSFGFMNRNDDALIEIPLGEDNFIEPAEYHGGQPTSFPVVRYSAFGGPRERGTFGVIVPADFEGDVWWTVTTDGYTTRVPGRLESPGPLIKGAYELSRGAMAAGSLRPAIRFTEGGPEGIGIKGIAHSEVLTATVGEPVEVRFWAFDRGERELGSVNMTLWKHQGPEGAKIAFESLVEALAHAAPVREGARPHGPGPVRQNDVIPVPAEGPNANQGHFRATFDTPGRHVIRIRIDNFDAPDSMPGQQCCWTNGYVVVDVSR